MKIPNKYNQCINLLLLKWKQSIPLAAAQRSVLEDIKYAKENNLPIPIMNQEFIQEQPILRINMIKRRIIEMIPELYWIMEDYNLPIELNSDDLIELYISHNTLMISKIKTFIRSRQYVENT